MAHKNLANAESYFGEHLAQNDYYSAVEIRPGQLVGTCAERLGLSGAVMRDYFRALCESRNPNDGKRLTQQEEDQRRVFYDFTCSAPKSVSVLVVTMDDERLVTAHEEAIRIAFRELEAFAATRVRKQGNQRDRTTVNMARRRVLTRLRGSGLLLHSVALGLLAFVNSFARLWIFDGLMGEAGGFIAVILFDVWNHAFGDAHLARIQGLEPTPLAVDSQ